MVDLAQVAIEVGAMAISGAAAWIVMATRTGKDVEAVRANLTDVKETQGRRLDGHDLDFADFRSNFISRREFDDRMAAMIRETNANYASIKDQLSTQGRWLEFAIFNKKPEQPGINGKVLSG